MLNGQIDALPSDLLFLDSLQVVISMEKFGLTATTRSKDNI